MTAVLVHGVPDTARLWDQVVAALGSGLGEVRTPSLPGFAAAPLAGGSSKEAYVEWLVAELEAVGEPVDLVGHDWGSLLVQRVASLRPELVRTLACGGAAVDAGYPWHDTAVAWQTPEVGEQVMAAMTPDALAEGLAGAGIPDAPAVAGRVDATMKASILELYRSAVHVGQEWQPELDAVAGRFPVLVLWGSGDPYVPPAYGEALADRLGGRSVVLDCGHWWPSERPDEVAAKLVAHWSGG